MALSTQIIETRLTAPDDQGVPTLVPAGEIQLLQNGIVEKFSSDVGGMSLRAQKRTAFRPLPTDIRDTNGAEVTANGFEAAPNLLSSLENRLVVASNTRPNVYSEGGASWTKYQDYVYSPLSLKSSIIYGQNTQVALPDVAQIGDVRMYSWTDVTPLNPLLPDTHTYTCRVMFIDQNGTVLRLPLFIATGVTPAPPRIKIVADGTRFWLVYITGGSFRARCYDTNGEQLGAEAALPASGNHDLPWDVTVIGSTVLVCHFVAGHTASTVDVTKLTFVSGAIVYLNTNMGGIATGDIGCAWAEKNVVNGDAYLLTTMAAIGEPAHPANYAFRITNLGTTPTVGFSFGTAGLINTDSGNSTGPQEGVCVQLTGVVMPDGFLHAQCSFVDGPGGNYDRRQDRIVFVRASTTTTTVVEEFVSLSVRAASRCFPLENGRWAFAVYMPSALTTSTLIPVTPTAEARQYSGNPTYFLLDVETSQMVGRFDDGQAGNEWTLLEYPTHPPFFYCVPHWINGNDGKTRTVFGRNADAITETFQERTNNDVIPFITVTRTISAVHIEQIVIGGLGQALEYASELFMPGALLTSFDGINFAEQGISIAPEQPNFPTQGSAMSGLTFLGFYTYQVVFEWTAPSGKRIRSSPSIPVQITLTGTNNVVTLTGLMGHMTNRPNLTISIYRNIVVAGVPTEILYKVTDDLNPIINDQFDVSSLTWTFVDNVTDQVAISREKLYTSIGYLARDPGPASNVICKAENRVFAVASDNAIWGTSEDTEGEPLWFSADGIRVRMPTTDPVVRIEHMDGRYYILCEKSVWTMPGGRWPGPDGLGGNIQPPLQLDIPNGCTGFSKVISGGIAYSSSTGGVWLITRSQTNEQLSAKAMDSFKGELSLSLATVNGMAIDRDQRFAISLVGTPGKMEIWDQVAKVWSTWKTASPILLSHVFKGKFIYADTVTVLAQSDSNYYDAIFTVGVGIIQSWIDFIVNVQYNLVNFKGLKRIWRFIVSGERRAPHTFNVQGIYVTEDDNQIEYWIFEPGAFERFVNDFQPRVEEMESLTLAFYDSPSAVTTLDTGDSFAVDLVSFEVGVDNNLSKIPPSTRRRQSV